MCQEEMVVPAGLIPSTPEREAMLKTTPALTCLYSKQMS